MGKRVVVAMSTSSLAYYTEPHDVRILNLKVYLGRNVYLDTPQHLTNDQFVRWIYEHPNELPKTSPPSNLEIRKFFLELLDEGYDEVLFVAMSSALSKTFQSVLNFIPLLQDKMKIHMFNTRTGTFTEAWMALEADKCFKQGWSIDKTITRLTYLRDNSHVFFGVDDLNYLVRNGRLTVTSQFFANLLRIKPLIMVNREGEAVVADKIMTTRRAMYSLAHRVSDILKTGKYTIFTLYAGEPRLHAEMVEILYEELGLKNLPAYPISPVVAAHIGPSGFGIGLLPL